MTDISKEQQKTIAHKKDENQSIQNPTNDSGITTAKDVLNIANSIFGIIRSFFG